ncbi:MAG: anti-sigma-D factor RsdA [Pseudonocardia sp.]|nr:anti-sigma-D factor RsdA [Pseudonocardia sp.]
MPDKDDNNRFGRHSRRFTDGHRTNGANGVHPDGMATTPIPLYGRERRAAEDVEADAADTFGTYGDEPIDLVAVQADDELINALSAGLSVSAPGLSGYDDDDRVVAMLAAWKAEVDAEPIPELVGPDEAVRAVESGRPRSARRRHLVPLAGAAALLVFSIAGVSLGAQSAQPGDPLFGVTRVLYTNVAESRQAAVEVRDRIAVVNDKLSRGDTTGAQQDIAALSPLLAKVQPDEGQTYLAAQQEFLAAKASETPPGQPTDPQAPLANGTPPPPAPSTEGNQDPAVPPVSSSSSSTPPSGVTSHPGTSGPSSGNPGTDPRTLNGPGTGGTSSSPSSSAPPSSSTSAPKPSTEGGPDTGTSAPPTSSSAPSTPTASGTTASGTSASGTSASGTSTGTTTFESESGTSTAGRSSTPA